MEGKTGFTIVRGARILTYFVYGFTIVALVILTIGFFLLLFGADPAAPFAEWMYRSLDRVMAPFRGIFETVPLNGDSVLDMSVLFAMIVYGIAGLFLSALIDWLTQKLGMLRARDALAATSQDGAARRPAAV